MIPSGNWRGVRNAVCELEGCLSFKERNTLRSNLGVIHKGRPHAGEGGWRMRAPVLILPVKGQILRTWG